MEPPTICLRGSLLQLHLLQVDGAHQLSLHVIPHPEDRRQSWDPSGFQSEETSIKCEKISSSRASAPDVPQDGPQSEETTLEVTCRRAVLPRRTGSASAQRLLQESILGVLVPPGFLSDRILQLQTGSSEVLNPLFCQNKSLWERKYSPQPAALSEQKNTWRSVELLSAEAYLARWIRKCPGH